jgi:hypothetical protein
MSKAQTDIRTTSYDELAARPNGYQGSIDNVIAQIRGEGGQSKGTGLKARDELLQFLGVKPSPSAGPSVELDQDVRYGEATSVQEAVDPGFYTLDYAMKHWPQNFSLDARIKALSVKQLRVYIVARNTLGVRESLALAEKTIN